MSEAGTEQTPAAPEAPAQEPTASWEQMFKGEDPAAVREALENSRKWEQRAKDNFEKAKQFEALEEAKKTDEQKLTERLEQLETEGRTATAQSARLEAVLALLPEDQAARLLDIAGRLRGDTPEELAADAKALSEWAPVAASAPSFEGGARSTSQQSDMNSIIRRAIRG